MDSIGAAYTTPWGGMNLYTTEAGGLDASEYETLDFWINGGTTGGQEVYVYITDTEENDHDLVLISDYLTGGIGANTWKHVSIPVEDIEADVNVIDQLAFMAGASTTIYYDEIEFVGEGSAGTSSTTFPIFRPVVQSLTYTYDAVGNITKIVSASDTIAAATTTYQYDDLYRIVSASTTQASSTPYLQTYSYNALGNLLNKSDIGTYSYSGDTGTNYANPHAPTTIGSTGYSYDPNGNLASTTAGLSNTWSYNNYLTQSQGGGTASTSYVYDHTGQRILKVSGGITTKYPNALYEAKGASTTKHIYVGDLLAATIESDTPAPAVYYNHLDHLGSTQVVTGEDGYLTQVLDYYPFGSTRIDEKYGSTNQSREYLGEVHDDETGLNYLGSRYQDAPIGKFISQDKANLDLGSQAWEGTYERPFELFLRDPQQLNTYSYARNNPMVVSDPGGEIIPIGIALYYAGVAGVGALTAYDAYATARTISDPDASVGSKLFAAGLFATPAGEIKAAGQLSKEAIQAALNRQKGQIGELNAGIVKNTEKIPSASNPGSSRIPDILNHEDKVIGDVKNVNYQSFTAQLRDFAEYAQKNSYQFVLTIDQRTQLSKTLHQLGEQIKIIRKKLDEGN